MNIEPVFPSFLATEMTDLRTDDIVAHALAQEQRYPTDHHSWQSPHGTENLEYPLWQPLLDHCRYKIPYFAEIYGLKVEADPRITDLWINITRSGNPRVYSAEPHVHANHWISFVFYAKAGPGSGALVINSSNPAAEYALPANLVGANTMYSSHKMTVQPETGLLVAFPSWLQHWADPNSDDQDRISIAMNVTLSHIRKS